MPLGIKYLYRHDRNTGAPQRSFFCLDHWADARGSAGSANPYTYMKLPRTAMPPWPKEIDMTLKQIEKARLSLRNAGTPADRGQVRSAVIPQLTNDIQMLQQGKDAIRADF